MGRKKASLQCPTEGDTAVDIFNYVPPDVKSSRGSPRFSSLMNRTYVLSKAWGITANILGGFDRSGFHFHSRSSFSKIVSCLSLSLFGNQCLCSKLGGPGTPLQI